MSNRSHERRKHKEQVGNKKPKTKVNQILFLALRIYIIRHLTCIGLCEIVKHTAKRHKLIKTLLKRLINRSYHLITLNLLLTMFYQQFIYLQQDYATTEQQDKVITEG